MNLTAVRKAEIKRDYPDCYVCKGLGVSNASLAGYEDRDVQFDHWLPQGLVGDKQAELLANLRPVHADSGGAHPLEPGWAAAARRNCHRGKSNTFTGQQWCDYVSIYRRALKTRYSDDLLPNRDPKDTAYDVEVEWDEDRSVVVFQGNEYPLMIQRVGLGAEKWQSFSAVVPPNLLWKDDQVQSRSATPERLAKFAWHLKENPLLTPILCRWSDRRLKVFDGNHRLCAFMLARENHAVPVTIFRGPDPKRFLSVAADAHDVLTQLKYQYTDKALKFSALHADELERAQEQYGELASEERAWQGLKAKDVSLRIIGRITSHLDKEGGWRGRWRDQGLTDPSWNEFIVAYARVKAESEPFSSEAYLREPELENLADLCQIFDEELFNKLDAHSRASLKTKWWKRAHNRFSQALRQVIKLSLNTGNMPDSAAYVPRWNDYIRSQIRQGVINWRQSPAWRDDTTANNEHEIDNTLTKRGFTESALLA